MNFKYLGDNSESEYQERKYLLFLPIINKKKSISVKTFQALKPV